MGGQILQSYFLHTKLSYQLFLELKIFKVAFKILAIEVKVFNRLLMGGTI